MTVLKKCAVKWMAVAGNEYLVRQIPSNVTEVSGQNIFVKDRMQRSVTISCHDPFAGEVWVRVQYVRLIIRFTMSFEYSYHLLGLLKRH